MAFEMLAKIQSYQWVPAFAGMTMGGWNVERLTSNIEEKETEVRIRLDSRSVSGMTIN